jgi:hypothetical protein
MAAVVGKVVGKSGWGGTATGAGAAGAAEAAEGAAEVAGLGVLRGPA